MRIGVPKEHRPDELRVAASPDTVKRLTGRGIDVLVEAGAGAGARYADQSFAEAGAKLVNDAPALYGEAEVILKVRRPLAADEGDLDEMALLRSGQVLVGMLNPYQHPDQVAAYAKAGVIAFALELLPRTTRAQAMDVLSSQANLAGYRAVIDGLAEFDRVMPMLMTAAGTVPPAKVFVIGAGVAGLQAIATSRRLGAVVSATDIRPAAEEEIESLGAKFVGVVKAEAATAGGYARSRRKWSRSTSRARIW
jgi:H+-translocating NAD(P) transhydrogenase subunit alpha